MARRKTGHRWRTHDKNEKGEVLELCPRCKILRNRTTRALWKLHAGVFLVRIQGTTEPPCL